jgi:hypothetical protein
MLSKERPKLRLGFHAWESPCGVVVQAWKWNWKEMELHSDPSASASGE